MKFLERFSTGQLVRMGNFLEYYDLYLYVHLGVVLQQHLFPETSDTFVKNFSLLGLYLIGPLASLIWGYVGDTKGRRVVLVKSSIFAAVVTTLIAFIPEYSWWDNDKKYFPLLILLLLRLMQSMAIAGESQAAKLYSMETYMSKDKKDFFDNNAWWNQKYLPISVTLMTMGESAGGMLALGMTHISIHYLGFLEWSWRIPFIFGALSVIFVVYIRSYISETAEFRSISKEPTILSFGSHIKTLKNEFVIKKKAVACYMLLCASYPVLFVFSYTFLSPMVIKALGYPKEFILTYNFFLVSAELCIEYFLVKIPVSLNLNKKVAMVFYHLITLSCVLAFISGIIDLHWHMAWYIVIQVMMISGINWNLIYGSVVKSFSITRRFTSMVFYGSSTKIIQFMVFSFVLPVFLNMNDVVIYGSCCCVIIFGAIIAACVFSPYQPPREFYFLRPYCEHGY